MISVIVPAYNSEKYLADCVESVFSQSETGWELLLVDDGSTDSTPALCDAYAARDPRVRAIHRPNGGLSEARNSGLDAAAGEFVCFLDSDDVMSPRFLELTLDALRDTDADIAAACFRPFEGNAPDLSPRALPDAVRLAPLEALRQALYQTPVGATGRRLDSSAWGKLYRRRLWENLRFRPGQWYEDLDLFYKLWAGARSVVFLPVDLTGYRQHPASFLHTFTPRRADVLDVTDRMLDYCAKESYPPEILRAVRTRRFAAHWNVLLLMIGRRGRPAGIINRCLAVLYRERRAVLSDRRARLKDRLGAFAACFLPPPRGAGKRRKRNMC